MRRARDPAPHRAIIETRLSANLILLPTILSRSIDSAISRAIESIASDSRDGQDARNQPGLVTCSSLVKCSVHTVRLDPATIITRQAYCTCRTYIPSRGSHSIQTQGVFRCGSWLYGCRMRVCMITSPTGTRVIFLLLVTVITARQSVLGV